MQIRVGERNEGSRKSIRPITKLFEYGNLSAGRAYGQPFSHGQFDASIAVSSGILAVGAPGETPGSKDEAGHAYTFNASTGHLVKTFTSPKQKVSGHFGYAIALVTGVVLVGEPGPSANSVFEFNPKSGALLLTLNSSSTQKTGGFGYSVGMTATTVIIGAPSQTVKGQNDAGNAFIFNNS